MPAKKYVTAVAITCLLFYHKSVAQSAVSDSAFYEQSLNNAIQLYTDKLGGYSNLYNGAEYIYNYSGIKGHPYFKTDSLINSFLYYDGILYRNIPLKYDLVTNEVLLKGKQNRLLKLVPEKLDYFSIGNDVFIHIKKDISKNDLPEPGFYQVLYDGQLTAIVQRRKKAQRSFRAEDPYQFAAYNDYYIKKDFAYYPINSEKDLINLFDKEKEAVRSHLRKSKINFKKDPEKAIVTAVAYYAQPKN